MVRGAIDGELEGDADISSSPSTFRFRPDMALLGTVRTPRQCAIGVLRLPRGYSHDRGGERRLLLERRWGGAPKGWLAIMSFMAAKLRSCKNTV